MIAILASANLWLFNKTFSKNESDLPKPGLGIFQASSFVIQNSTASKTENIKPINILVLGQSGAGYIAPDLTDTILVARLDMASKKAKIVSIPRDLAVKIPGNEKNIVKLNALYQIGSQGSEKEGLKLIQKKVEEITGLNIDKFALFDLSAVENVINDIGGINIYVKTDIEDTRFPTNAGGYETFSLQKGVRWLDGQTALKFVRTRHSPRGDFDRIERQQAVVKAIKGKLMSLNPIWDFPKLWAIYKSVKENVRTDLSLADFRNIWSLGKNIDLENIETLSLNPENGLVTPEKMKFGRETAYVLVAKGQQFDYTTIKSAIADFITK